MIATLEEAGYVCRWQRVETRAEFLACLDAPDYDLILADYNLPTFDGLTALKLFLERGLDLPFILVSGTLGEETAIESLKAGATDYVLKDRLSRLGPVVRRALHEKEEQRQRKRAEEALRESERRFRDLFDGVPACCWTFDREGRILDWNRACEELYGWTAEQAIGKTMYELMVKDENVARTQETIAAVFQGQSFQGLELEYENWRADGSTCNMLVSEYPLRDASGQVIMGICAELDITERVRAEEEIKQLAKFPGENPNPVLRVAKDGTIIYANEAASPLLNVWGCQEGQPLPDGWRQFTLDVLSSGSSKDTDIEYENRILSLTFAPVVDADYVNVYGLDITERVRAEEERALLVAQIREQARQMQQTMDTVPEGVLLLDADLRVLLANPVAKGNLAVLADASVGDTLTHLGDRPLAELLTSPPKGLWHEVAADGRSFEVIARPMENSPEPEGWVLVIRDVTQEREIQQRVQQQERLAAVGQLAAGIAHDFNNIMAIIVLYARMSLWVPDLLPPRVHERLETIDQQAKRATVLIQQILDFSRRAVLERRPMDLVPFLKEVVKLLERTVPESIKMSLNYGSDEYTVNADPTRVQQVIMNLVVNARDAMPEGGELHIGLSRTAPGDEIRCLTCGPVIEGEWVRVTVSDTGTGIPPDVRPRIFDPFFTTKERGEGTGLGLAQVHGIVKQHEGHIDVETEMGEGTTFILYLPALLVAEPEALPEERLALPQGQGETILVVEDNAAMREALVDSLEILNYRVLEASNGREALSVVERHGDEIDLVLSDVVMPEMGGIALFHALKQRYSAVRVVLLTGHPMEEELETLRAEGLSDWLPKPPSPEQLAQVVARALREG